MFHERTKHIEIDCHFVQEHILAGDLTPNYLPSKYQLADICTKALGRQQIQFLLGKLGIVNPYAPTWGGVLGNIMYLGDIVSSFLVVYGFLFPNSSMLRMLRRQVRVTREHLHQCMLYIHHVSWANIHRNTILDIFLHGIRVLFLDQEGGSEWQKPRVCHYTPITLLPNFIWFTRGSYYGD